MTDEKKQCRRRRQKESQALRYSKLSEEKKESIRAAERVKNLSPKKKLSMAERRRKKNVMKRNMLRGDSIAMENPIWVPEPAQESTPSVVPILISEKASEFIDFLEYKGSPILPPAHQSTAQDVNTFDMTAARRTKGRHVPGGVRQAVMVHRNQKFEQKIKKCGLDTEPVYTQHVDLAEENSEQPNNNQMECELCPLEEDLPPPPIPDLGPNDDDDYEGVVLDDDSDDEGYLFAGQEEESEQDTMLDDVVEEPTSPSDGVDPYDNVYIIIPQDTHMLKLAKNCKHCNAQRFQHETTGFCCGEGKVKLSNSNTPPELMGLWSSTDSLATHFRDNIKFFNGHFSFTSLYCNLDGDTTDVRNSGIYTFRAHGQMYHNISIHKDHEQKDREVIRMLASILRDNPYSEQLRRLGQAEDLEDYRITLNLDQRLDQRTHNVPLTSEVAAIWVEGSEHRGQFENSVLLHGKNREIHGIRSYHPSYDPLSYPLFFPKREIGWHQKIPKAKPKTRRGQKDKKSNGKGNKAKKSYEEVNKEPKNLEEHNDDDTDSAGNSYISIRDYYCYKFQIRPGIFNPVIYGKRLFQQFVVDTYIKIESSRLDYIWLHQDKLRADLYQGLVDSLAGGEGRTDAVGKRTVLPASFIGGPRDMRRR
ncbi:hypothetical protein ACP4OV_007505 [Aristida adscensionis]